MSKTLEKRAVAAEATAAAKLDADANIIFQKYGFDPHRIAKEASKEETEIIFRWGEPHFKQVFDDFMNVFFSPLMSDFFEREIYPKTLLYGDMPGNEGLILGLDNLYLKTVYSDLYRRFAEKIEEDFKRFKADPNYVDTGIGQELADEFKKAYEHLDRVKAKARENLQKTLAILRENET